MHGRRQEGETEGAPSSPFLIFHKNLFTSLHSLFCGFMFQAYMLWFNLTFDLIIFLTWFILF